MTHRLLRDFTMLRAVMLVALIAMAQLLHAAGPQDGDADGLLHKTTFPLDMLIQCDKDKAPIDV